MIKYLSLSGGILALDTVIKKRVEKKRARFVEKPICKGKIHITKFYNTGVAGSRLENKPGLVLALHSAMMAFVSAAFARLFSKTGEGNAVEKVGYSFILGGGMSNLLDRITKGYVVDYFRINCKWKRIRRLIFNISDWFIFAGSICIVVGELMKKKD